jgi:hypothetical protein
VAKTRILPALLRCANFSALQRAAKNILAMKCRAWPRHTCGAQARGGTYTQN